MARGGHWLPPDRLYHPKASGLLPTLVGSCALVLLLILRWSAGRA